ncbi:ATP-binding protein [Anaerotruncus sp. 80]|jgi:AAA15 family ATPase/GTPase|uniref:ATP-binding protein n=1 Tax=Anaerotruncus colihominis TaxID=169435 RepID=A0A845QIG9_9FIRM|nr:MULTISPECIES: AAA family ATPase [Clostridia]NBH60901.1 ATP-binding protein [Anaerotruncus colihominis]NCE98477.1 ATP-binding protein [Emergencia sp. 1XD21-10]NCF01556.1 ATP-binding protein [Anaerotruncus sp. 80]
MKLLRVKANGFKNCKDDFTIDFTAKSKKTAEDKEYELQKIAEDLYVFNTMAFVGKNASGKTSAIELLDCCYSILGNFRLEEKYYHYDGIQLEIIFFHENSIYRYTTELKGDSSLGNKANFVSQHLYQKPYYKSKVNGIFDLEDFTELKDLGALPEDTSILFFALEKKRTQAFYFDSFGSGTDTYQLLFKAMKAYEIEESVFLTIIRIFDENIKKIERVDAHNYRLAYGSSEEVVSDNELLHFLSSGTTKGIFLYILMVASLKNGFDLLIDEIENHFHKTLVENMISLYKDKNVNRKNASLIFTTHYCEVLDLFNRQDNIWISKASDKVELYNMYSEYNVRSELLKSKQFYCNAFNTAVDYETLMKMKKELMA